MSTKDFANGIVLASGANPATCATSSPLNDVLDSLLSTRKLSPDNLARSRQIAVESGEPVTLVLVNLGLISDRDLADQIARALGWPIVDGRDLPDAPVLSDVFNTAFLRRSRVLPFRITDDQVHVAFVDPLAEANVQAIRFAIGQDLLPYIILPQDFEKAFDRLYGAQAREAGLDGAATDHAEDLERLQDSISDAPVVRLVNSLIENAVAVRASDIHVEPMDGHMRIRYRIDGALREVEPPDASMAAAIVSRIKVMARLNIAERRLAQDGRIRLAVRGNDIDFRISTTPTLHGESVVLRILDRSDLKLDLTALGIDDAALTKLRQIVGRPHGIFLVTGPTGSGKTTTLYASLLELNTADRKILTIEDPIEYRLSGINQVQVRPQIGLTFASALRSFLRQDPDIMMVGEIRDLETAQIAVQAALTGHLILSTLHTNDAPSAITRLLDMGVEEFLLTSTINGIAAQRLVRKLCRDCRQPYQPLPEMLERCGIASGHMAQFHHAKGCPQCNGTGYKGRTSIMEIMPMSDAIRQHVLHHADAAVIRSAALAEGMQSLFAAGIDKAMRGETSLDEVFRVAEAA